MGKRGPAPKPTALKVKLGNPGRRPLNEREPVPDGSKPWCPRHLSKGAKREWRRMAGRLHACGLLTQVDRDVLAVYCEVYARWVEAEDMVREHGMLVTSPNGYPQFSPYLNVANRCISQMKSLMRELGLTPAARSTIAVDRPEGGTGDVADELDRDLARFFGVDAQGPGPRAELEEVA